MGPLVRSESNKRVDKAPTPTPIKERATMRAMGSYRSFTHLPIVIIDDL